MNRLERGCYFDFIQAQRKFHGITIEQVRKILGKDFETCWSALELILSKEKEFYFIEWVRESMEQRKKHAEQQRKRIQDYWDKKKQEIEEPRKFHGISVDIPLEEESENEDEIVIDTVVEEYNKTAFSKIQKLSDKRKSHIKARIKEYGINTVLDTIQRANKSNFLHGENNNKWAATFDWIVNPSNFLKIMEGNYDNRVNGKKVNDYEITDSDFEQAERVV
jgi:hypothetical protein